MSKDGNPLSVYSSYNSALESASYTGKNMIPYCCQRCGKYHLKPKEYYCEKVFSRCDCVDHNGKPKDTYKTMNDALKMVKIRAGSGIKLSVYKCPLGYGYHLTSQTML